MNLECLEHRLVPALVINPLFDASITNDPNAATIENTINTAIKNLGASFSNYITVNIKFQEGGNILGTNITWFIPESYTSFRANLAAAATTSDAKTAVASLPISNVDPLNKNADVWLTEPDARALGYTGAIPANGAPDSVVTLETSICNLSRSSIAPTKYDLQSVATHEMDEVLGFSSALNGLANGAAAPTGAIYLDDLSRYDQNGNRSLNTNAASQAYFSIDGGHTDLARFNQQSPTGADDYSDWYSPGTQTPQVQDAFNTKGATPNLGVELRRLNVDGYTPAALAAPTGLTAKPVSSSQKQPKLESGAGSNQLHAGVEHQ